MKDYDTTCDLLLKEMFARVGETYPNKKLTDQKDWFTQRSWTTAEENDWKLWAKKLIKKRHPSWRVKLIDKELSWFLLMWGWKNSDWAKEKIQKGDKNV